MPFVGGPESRHMHYKSKMVDGRHLGKIAIISAAVRAITTKFGMLAQLDPFLTAPTVKNLTFRKSVTSSYLASGKWQINLATRCTQSKTPGIVPFGGLPVGAASIFPEHTASISLAKHSGI